MDLVFTLKEPIADATGFKHEALTMRELTVDEHISLEAKHGSKPMLAQDREHFAMMCGVPAEVIGQMKAREWQKLRRFYQKNLGNDEPESETSE